MSVSVTALLLVLVVRQASSRVTLNDALHYSGKICRYKLPQSVNEYGDRTMALDTCSCDSLCASYGDCCVDSEYFVAEEQLWGKSRASCIEHGQESFYAFKQCSQLWTEENFRINCEAPDDTYPDPLLSAPVTSRRTNITYFNGYCAICNGDFNVMDVIWPVNFACEYMPQLHQNLQSVDDTIANVSDLNITSDHLNTTFNSKMYLRERVPNTVLSPSKLYYEKETRSWYLNASENSLKCFANFIKPKEAIVRYCIPYLIGSCADDWNNTDVESRCLTYTDYWCDGLSIYRNPFCAYCNYVSLSESHVCAIMHDITRPRPAVSFSVLLDWSRLSSLHNCPSSERYDPIKEECRDTTSILQEGSRWVHFCCYSSFCWTLPVLVLTPALVDECSGGDSRLKPGYGVTNCWIQNRDALLVYVVAPLCTVMTLNVVFFSWSSYLIYSTKSKLENQPSERTDFRLLVRLALIMGLTWLTGLVAGAVGWKVLWYIFVALNTLKGVFIFVAFSCKKRVLKELRKEKQTISSSTGKTTSNQTSRF